MVLSLSPADARQRSILHEHAQSCHKDVRAPCVTCMQSGGFVVLQGSGKKQQDTAIFLVSEALGCRQDRMLTANFSAQAAFTSVRFRPGHALMQEPKPQTSLWATLLGGGRAYAHPTSSIVDVLTSVQKARFAAESLCTRLKVIRHPLSSLTPMALIAFQTVGKYLPAIEALGSHCERTLPLPGKRTFQSLSQYNLDGKRFRAKGQDAIAIIDRPYLPRSRWVWYWTHSGRLLRSRLNSLRCCM